MKKKLLALMLATAMTASVITGCSSGNTGTGSGAAESTSQGEYQFVSAGDAVKAAADGSAHVLDVREWANYSTGRIANSQWQPIFPLEDETLADEMKTYAVEKLNDGQKIYIVCNSGQRGAQKTTEVLQGAGIDAGLIYTVEGGAKALAEEKGALTTDRTEENIDWQYAKATDVLALENAQIVDVRDDDTYSQGHLENSIQVNLKEFESADAQNSMYELAADLNKDEPVYFLCYSGNKVAKTAISVLKDAGFDEKNLFIIEGGAKDSDIEAAFVK